MTANTEPNSDAPEIPPRPRESQRTVDRAGLVRSLLHAVDLKARTLAETKLKAAAPLLDHFDGIPAPIDVLEIIGRDRSEHVYCNLLAWLMNPLESHGLADGFLRRFLAVAGITHRGRVFRSNDVLLASVRREVTLPQDVIRRPGGLASLGAPRIDLVVALDDLVLTIEVKVEAESHPLLVRRNPLGEPDAWMELPQASAYLAATYRLARDPELKAEYERFVQPFATANVVRAHGKHRIRGILVHLPQLARTDHTAPACGGGSREKEGEFRTAHVTWADIDRIVQACVVSRQPRHEVSTLLASFRTSILRLIAQGDAGRYDLVRLVERLRVLSAHRTLVAKSPIETYRQIDELQLAISHRDECTQHQPSYREFPHVF